MRKRRRRRPHLRTHCTLSQSHRISYWKQNKVMRLRKRDKNTDDQGEWILVDE